MSETGTKQERQEGADQRESPAFRPVVAGTLRKRLCKYAIDKGRSMNGAALWLMNQQLKAEGY